MVAARQLGEILIRREEREIAELRMAARSEAQAATGEPESSGEPSEQPQTLENAQRAAREFLERTRGSNATEQ